MAFRLSASGAPAPSEGSSRSSGSMFGKMKDRAARAAAAGMAAASQAATKAAKTAKYGVAVARDAAFGSGDKPVAPRSPQGSGGGYAPRFDEDDEEMELQRALAASMKTAAQERTRGAEAPRGAASQVPRNPPGLEMLMEMGFEESLVRIALQASDGDVEAALAQLCADREDLEGVQRTQCDLLYHRQYLCYLLNLQEDVSTSLEKLRKGQQQLREELMDLDALVGGRVSVPKEQVYPRFDALARCYRSAWKEVQTLESRAKLQSVLLELRQRYFPTLSINARAALAKAQRGDVYDENREDPVDLDSIPGPDATDPSTAVRLTVENYESFLNLPLDFQGFCVQSLVARKGLLVPGNPALGVVRYAGRYCVFSSERAMAEFCTEPDRFFAGVREACYRQPELIHLLRVHEDFPRSSLQAILEMMSGQQSVMLADVACETPLHFQESYIDKSYEWNEWKLRQDALHVADIRRKTTSTTQTAFSHLRRENETQVYLPKEAATSTSTSRGTNPPRLKKYFVGLRGVPQPMQVAKCRYDL